MSLLLEGARATTKGTLPVISLPTLHGAGWDQLKAARYETIDHVVKAEDIQLFDNTGRVEVKGIAQDFRLTPFSATGFAWCSFTPDRACEGDNAGALITASFREQGEKEYRLRSVEGIITAILSPNYYPMKNSEIVDGVLKMQKTMEAVNLFYLSPYKTSIALESKKKFKMAGEQLSAGVKIDNGEHGKKSFDLLSRMVQYICGNGVVIGSGETIDYHRRHTSNEQNWENFDIVGAVSEIITSVMSTQGILEHLEDLSLRVLKTKEDTIKRVIQTGALGMRQAEVFPKCYDEQRVLRGRTKSETMYDVFNGITAMKNHFPKSRFMWEDLGGQILLDPANFYAAQN